MLSVSKDLPTAAVVVISRRSGAVRRPLTHSETDPRPVGVSPATGWEPLCAVVMAGRDGVQVASAPIAAVDTLGLAAAFGAAALRIPLRAPWRGPSSPLRNVAVACSREFVRSLMGYMTSLPIDEFRALERLLDDVSRAILPPVVHYRGAHMTAGAVGGIEGLWFRPSGPESGRTILYLHGGGFIGTSPSMYAVFMAHLVRVTGCQVFVADYRLAPEFPYPAACDDVAQVVSGLLAQGIETHHLFLAGDSGGGGLAGSVLDRMKLRARGGFAGVILFSPEVSFVLDQPSVKENAELDILPWNIPTNPYLHGADPSSASVLGRELTGWPPTFVAYGSDEIFRDATREFVAQLDTYGVDHESYEAEGMFHAFPFLLPWARESREVYRRVGEFVRRVSGTEAAPE